MAEDSSFDDSTVQTNGPAGATPSTRFGRRIFQTLLDILDLQIQIIVLRLLAYIRNIVLIVFLAGLAAMAVLLGVIFAYIAIYHALLQALPSIWVDIIFAAFHLFLALALIGVLVKIRRDSLQRSQAAHDEMGENL